MPRAALPDVGLSATGLVAWSGTTLKGGPRAGEYRSGYPHRGLFRLAIPHPSAQGKQGPDSGSLPQGATSHPVTSRFPPVTSLRKRGLGRAALLQKASFAALSPSPNPVV